MPQLLDSKQRSFLRGLAHHLEPVVQVGKGGASESVVRQVVEQLRAHELIKVRFGKGTEDLGTHAQKLAGDANCSLVACAGRVVTLYRRHDKKPTIELPTKDGKGTAKRDHTPKQKTDPRRSVGRPRKTTTSRSSAPRERGRGNHDDD